MIDTRDPHTAREPASNHSPAAHELADWLLARGRHWVTTANAAAILGIPAAHVSPTLARWVRKGQLFSPTGGAYVPIPPEYRSWGAVPAAHFIDPMMRCLGHDYYVALLSAAEAHGVAHQRPQVFQVMTSARLRDRSFGRVRIEFVLCTAIEPRATVTMNTPTGTMTVSAPHVTALDLVAMPERSGGLSNVATVLGQMLEDSLLDIGQVADAARDYPVSVAQRAGLLLEMVAAEVGVRIDLAPLEAIAESRTTPTPLLPSGRRAGPRDDRWNVLVNTPIESDL